MNRAQTDVPVQGDLFQTWNPLLDPSPDKVLGKSYFQRPLVSQSSRSAQRQIVGLQGHQRLWLAGAYVPEGIPLLEAGCVSGLQIAQALGRTAPWWRALPPAPADGWLAYVAPWVQAARPSAFFLMGMPILLGQLMATPALAPGPCFLVMVIGFLIQMMLVYSNDAADETVDKINTTFDTLPGIRISGGSRVVQQNKLSPTWLYGGALTAFLVALGLSAAGATRWNLVHLPHLTVVAAGITWMYNLPPFHLAHHGYGELLQGLGCGIVLVALGFSAQSPGPDWWHKLPLLPMVSCFLIFFSSHLLTALPDTPSDRVSNKRTYAVRYGEAVARTHALDAVLAAALLSLFSSPLNAAPLWSVVPVLVVAAFMRRSPFLMEKANIEYDPAACTLFILSVSLLQFWLFGSWILILSAVQIN